MYYLQSRYFNPEWGRFINADAIAGRVGELLGHNIFAYCKNNPINMSDPSGFYACRDIDGSDYVPKSNNSIKSKSFYTDGEGAKVDLAGKSYSAGSRGYKTDGELFKAQLFSGEAGLAKVYSDGEYTDWYVKGPGLSGDVGVAVLKASLYGKASLADLGGSVYFPIPFTNHKIEVGGDVDIFSIGGGLDVNINPAAIKKRIKFGVHAGIGADLQIGLQ